jgi:hypothetical protein
VQVNPLVRKELAQSFWMFSWPRQCLLPMCLIQVKLTAVVANLDRFTSSAQVGVTADLSLLGIDAEHESSSSDDDGLGEHFEVDVGCERLRSKE